ncbi:hypothetical protein [Sphingobacterium multivorum]|uniref:hypothetical protein n=1 Tax=Sphingobacterium multivorum TaxID=28454 RepID=UPI003DA401A3
MRTSQLSKGERLNWTFESQLKSVSVKVMEIKGKKVNAPSTGNKTYCTSGSKLLIP